MGKRGPRAKATWMKELEGNPGKRSLNKTGIAVEPRRVTCPAWLSAEAKAEWKRLAPELQRLGLLTPLDRAAFAIYCQSLAHWRECQRMLDEHGPVYLTPNGRLREWRRSRWLVSTSRR